MLTLIISFIFFIYPNFLNITYKNGITLLKYSPAKTKKESFNFKIQTYNSLRGIDWINDNEILTASGEFFTPKTYSSYNLDTEKSKILYSESTSQSYKLTNGILENPYSMSRDKKFFLFDTAINSIKLINFESGEIKNFNVIPSSKNSIFCFNFIDDNKIFSYSFTPYKETYTSSGDFAWQLNDINGKILKSEKEGNFPGIFLSSYALNQHKFLFNTTNSCNLFDLYTHETKIIHSAKNFNGINDIYFRNNTIIIESNENLTSTRLSIFDYNGNKKNEISFNQYVLNLSISPDGTKAALISYPDFNNYIRKNPKVNKSLPEAYRVSILDLKTGSVKTIYENNSVILSTIEWNKDGSSLMFSGSLIGEYSSFNTYIARME